MINSIFRYMIKSLEMVLIMSLLTGCYFWDAPKQCDKSQIIEDFAFWQNYIENFVSEHSYDFISKDFDGIDLEKKEWNGGTFIENEISLDDKWSIIIVLSVENSVEWFEIELRNDDFEEYNEEYILQVVGLYNDMSNYEFKEKKILNFIDAYSSDKEVHERRDNKWSMSDFYMLEQNIQKKEVVFTVGGWLKKDLSNMNT